MRRCAQASRSSVPYLVAGFVAGLVVAGWRRQQAMAHSQLFSRIGMQRAAALGWVARRQPWTTRDCCATTFVGSVDRRFAGAPNMRWIAFYFALES